MRENIALSDRLLALACMVTKGNRVCDVGCDHGFLSIYLYKKQISPKIIAMDVNEGPLMRAKEHIREYGAQIYIETRLSDGLSAYQAKEADTLICAGMGGRLMIRILAADVHKTASFKELIMQPQSEVQQFRGFLRSQGYKIVSENMIEEDGKFYPMMKAVKAEDVDSVQDACMKSEYVLRQSEQTREKTGLGQTGVESGWYQQIFDRYGELLIQNKSAVLYRYLEKEKRTYEQILNNLSRNEAEGNSAKEHRNGSRYEEVETLLRDCVRVMGIMDDSNYNLL
ncbi:MAG: class I SAM-dependent methyltransferase [Clostridiales bacterium]|nr:class I SAM-dependent methyltransferase [Clostridiales bacterium]